MLSEESRPCHPSKVGSTGCGSGRTSSAQRDAQAARACPSQVSSSSLKFAIQLFDTLPHADETVVMGVLGIVSRGSNPSPSSSISTRSRLRSNPKHNRQAPGPPRGGWHFEVPPESASAGCPRSRCRARPDSPRSCTRISMPASRPIRCASCETAGTSRSPLASRGAGSTPPAALRPPPRGPRTGRGRAVRRRASARSPAHGTRPRAASTRRRILESTCRASLARAGRARRAPRRTAGGCCAHAAGTHPTPRVASVSRHSARNHRVR